MKVRAGLVTVAALGVLALSACGPDHHRAVDFTGSALTPDKGEIKGMLTTIGGPGSSAEPIQGSVDLSTVGGHDYGTVSPGPTWDFEVKPGAYRLQGTTISRLACDPVVVKVVKGTIQDVDITCPAS